jgi:hypothetical protein
MARAAEINRGAGIEPAWIVDHTWVFTHVGLGCGNVGSSRAMTSCAGNAGNEMGGIEMVADVGRGRMAAETGRRFVGGNLAADCIFERIGNTGRMVRSDLETDTTEKTDASFIEASFALEQKSFGRDYRFRMPTGAELKWTGHRW